MLWHKLIGLAILSLALTQLEFVQSDVSASGCRTNYTLVEGKCVQAFNYWLNWFEADRYCRSLGAGLLSLQNQTQYQKISQWINTTLPYTLYVWTSGNSLGQKGTYFWQSTGEQARYLSWSNGGPRPAEGDCLTLSANNVTNWFSDYRLNINTCSFWAPIICEHKPQSNNTINNHNTTSRICLKPGSYETAQVLV